VRRIGIDVEVKGGGSGNLPWQDMWVAKYPVSSDLDRRNCTDYLLSLMSTIKEV